MPLFGDTMDKYLEAGKIINTHGIRGEVKIDPWANSAAFLRDFPVFYVDGKSVKVRSARVHQRFLIASLEGVDSIEDAEKLKNKVICIDREDAKLSEGEYFLSDLLGFTALDEAGQALGEVTDILEKPQGAILEVQGEREILVPLIPEFVISRDMDARTITLRLLEGM